MLLLFGQGGVVGITINWDCDLDWSLKYCVPVYKFHRLYNEDSNVSPGYNFRYGLIFVVVSFSIPLSASMK